MHRTTARMTLAAAAAAVGAGALLGAPSARAATAPGTVLHAAATPVLRVGSSGNATRTWQTDLDRLSAAVPGLRSIAVDAAFGPRTAAATRDFQRYAKIGVDGVVGPRTRAAMNAALRVSTSVAGGTLGVGSRGAAVRAWQRDLDRVSGTIPGVPTIAQDGVFGPRTVAATLAFQRFAEIGVNGVVTPQTRTAMATALHDSPSGAAATLGVGSRGAAVRAWQRDLDRVAATAKGLPTVAQDGDFGPRTAAATLAFQRYAKIGVNGVVTQETRSAMATALDSQAPTG